MYFLELYCYAEKKILLLSYYYVLCAAKVNKMSLSNGGTEVSKEFQSADAISINSSNGNLESLSPGKASLTSSSNQESESYSARQKGVTANSSPASANSHQKSIDHPGFEILLNDGLADVSSVVDNGLSEEQKEQFRFSRVGRKKDFVCSERINGKPTNILKGLELHTKVFNPEEQKKIVECVYNLQRMGRKGQLRGMLEKKRKVPFTHLCNEVFCSFEIFVYILTDYALLSLAYPITQYYCYSYTTFNDNDLRLN